MRELCNECGERLVAINYYKDGKVHYRKKCDHCAKKRREGKPRWVLAGYKKKTTCDRCGHSSRYEEQFNVYHVDGEPANCRFSNLKTVCANCQRILYKLNLPWKRGDLLPDF